MIRLAIYGSERIWLQLHFSIILHREEVRLIKIKTEFSSKSLLIERTHVFNMVFYDFYVGSSLYSYALSKDPNGRFLSRTVVTEVYVSVRGLKWFKTHIRTLLQCGSDPGCFESIYEKQRDQVNFLSFYCC